jgi:catechol 2,3-dioxygenase-like lactoylglutathione lyase family enzyme
MILGQFETSLDVKDIGRSWAFYKALGFRHVDGGVEVRTVGLRRGDCRLTLFQDHLDPPQTQLIFWQGDVLAIARELIARGLAFDEGHPRSDHRGNASAMIRDPDGHPIFFINMPINFVDHPGHAHKMPRYRPSRLKPDKRLGWFELSLMVRNVERSRAFYETLGFGHCQTDDGGRSVTLQNNDCRIALRQDVVDPAEARLIFRQGDIEAIARDLAHQGIAFEQGSIGGDDAGTQAHLRDPDGHAIHFVNTPGVQRHEPV